MCSNMNLLNHILSLVCHQDPTRTLSVAGAFLPLCARCTGIYLSFFGLWIFLASVGRTRQWLMASPAQAIPAAALLAAGLALSMAEALHWVTFGPASRMFVGAAAGSGLALLLRPVFNQLVARRTSGSAAHLTGLFIAGAWFALLVLLSLWDSSIAFYLLAVGSVAGMMVLYVVTNMNVASLMIGWGERPTLLGVINLVMLTGVLIIIEAFLIFFLNR